MGVEPRGGGGSDRPRAQDGCPGNRPASALCVWTLVWMGELSWSLSVEGVELYSLGGVFISGLNE